MVLWIFQFLFVGEKSMDLELRAVVRHPLQKHPSSVLDSYSVNYFGVLEERKGYPRATGTDHSPSALCSLHAKEPASSI